jgi:hypothetical protein
MPKDEIRQWIKSYIIPIKGGMAEKQKYKSHRLTIYTIARHLDIHPANLYNMVHEKRKINPYQQKLLTRFIEEYDLGYWEIYLVKGVKKLRKAENPMPQRKFSLNLGQMTLNTPKQTHIDKMPSKLWRN